MTAADDLRRVEALFHAADELPPSERRAWLEGQCGDDRELLARVVDLLRLADEPGQLATPVPVAAQQGSSVGEAPLPERIGDFRILGRLGMGGFGVVFLAEQDAPRRRVALKVLRDSFASPLLQRRFEHEVELLGRVDHSGICRILAAGNDQGRPFFAMELVEGLPLLDFVATHKPSAEQRVRLWLQIVEAVAHAHGRGVLHRDLKPQNVLVVGTAETAQCKVLDFGIGRSLDASTSALTLTGQLLGTLEYMSPEQFRGDAGAVDVRTDVWALGAIGYELFAGAPPFALRELPLVEAVRIVQSTPARRLPTTVASTAAASIVQRCLCIDPDGRYATANDLAADLQRLLRGEPVTARGHSTLLHLRWLVRRHFGLIAATGTIMLTLVVATIVSLSLLFEARAERDAATEVTRFLTDDVIGGADPELTSGEVRTLRQAAQNARDRLGDRFADSTRVRAEVTAVLGETLLSLGDWSDAQKLLAEAAALRAQQFGADHRATFEIRAKLCACLDRLGDPNALAEREGLLADLRRALGPDDELAISTLDGVAHTCRTTGDLQRSRTLHLEAVERATRVLGAEHRFTLVARNNLAITEGDLGNYVAAAAIDREVWTIRQRVLGPEHPHTLASQANLALQLWYDRATPGYAERLQEAERHTTEALRGRERVLGVGHPQSLLSQNNLMLIQLAREDLAAAEATGRELVARYRRSLGDEHADTLRAVSNFCDVLSRTAERAKWREAADLSAANLVVARRVVPDDNWMLAWHMTCTAAPLFRLEEDLDRARDLAIEALAGYRRVLGDQHTRTRGLAKRLVSRGKQFGWTIDPEWERLANPQ